MKRLISLLLVIVLCLALSVSAFANSPQYDVCDCCDECTGTLDCDCGCATCIAVTGSPKTGSIALAALTITACTAGGISVLAARKAK